MSAPPILYHLSYGRNFRAVLTDWLNALPATGWVGTVTELGDELDLLAGDRWTPHGAGLTQYLGWSPDLLEQLGWRMKAGRTKSQRYIEFRRVKPGRVTEGATGKQVCVQP